MVSSEDKSVFVKTNPPKRGHVVTLSKTTKSGKQFHKIDRKSFSSSPNSVKQNAKEGKHH